MSNTVVLALVGFAALSMAQDASACDRYRQATVYYYSGVRAVAPTVEVRYPSAHVKVTAHRAVVQQVAAVQVEVPVRRSEVTVGTTIRLNTRFAGAETGAVFLTVGNIKVECPVAEWSTNQITFSVPAIGLNSDTAGVMSLVRGNGSLLRDIPVTLVSDQDQFKVVETPVTQANPEAAVTSFAPAPLD